MIRKNRHVGVNQRISCHCHEPVRLGASRQRREPMIADAEIAREEIQNRNRIRGLVAHYFGVAISAPYKPVEGKDAVCARYAKLSRYVRALVRWIRDARLLQRAWL